MAAPLSDVTASRGHAGDPPACPAGFVAAGARLRFSPDQGFARTVRARVEAQLGDRPRQGDPRLLRKAAVVAVWFALSYAGALLAQPFALQAVFWVSLGLAASALGFNVFHDANHGAFVRDPRRNLLIARITCVVLGPARVFWHFKHHVLHHRYTNVHRWDDDVETRGFLRMSPHQPWLPRYRFQHLFFGPLYALNTIEWFFIKDFTQYFTLHINPYQKIPPLTRKEKIEFWATKAIYALLFVAVPFLAHPPVEALAGLLVFHLTFGASLSFIFQLAHATEFAVHPLPSGNPATIEDEWAAHEMRTTANFGTGNAVLNWFAGGLNFQVEHHLFPGISHTYYPEISPTVAQTARDFGLPYNVHDTYLEAVTSHYRTLRALAAPPAPAGA